MSPGGAAGPGVARHSARLRNDHTAGGDLIQPERLREYALTAGETGGAAAQTTMVVLLPILLRDVAPSALWIGFVVGAEGIFAILVPLTIGALSDRLPERLTRRFGRRSIFIIAATPVMAACLALTPFLVGYWLMAGIAFLFFAAFHVFMTPLWALIIDAVPDERRARVNGVRGAFHSAGLAYGLVAGGVLLSVWQPLPFLLAALLLVLCAAATLYLARTGAGGAEREPLPTHDRLRAVFAEIRGNPDARWLLLANALWNGAIDGIRPWFFLYAAVVIGVGTAATSAGMIFLVVGLGIGSVVAGRLGDHHDRKRILLAGSVLTAIAMGIGFFMRSIEVAIGVLIIAGIGASTIVALPFPIYASLTDDKRAGQHTGVFVVSVGFGRFAAPLLVGAAIDLGNRYMPQYEGYPFMWLVAATLAALGCLALLRVQTPTRADA